MKTVSGMLAVGMALTGMVLIAGTETIIIQGPDEVIDSFLVGDKSVPVDSNYGSRTTVDVNRSNGVLNRNGIFRWDLGSVPGEGKWKISKVEIMLYVNSYNGPNTYNYDLRQITGGDWVETEVTAVNRVINPAVPWANQTAQPWGDLSTETYGTVNVALNTWVTFSSVDNIGLLTLIRGMVDGTVDNYGFSVDSRVADAGVIAKFRSTDHGTSSTRPKMIITISPPQGTLILVR